jgi:hypothetical protein
MVRSDIVVLPNRSLKSGAAMLLSKVVLLLLSLYDGRFDAYMNKCHLMTKHSKV